MKKNLYVLFALLLFAGAAHAQVVIDANIILKRDYVQSPVSDGNQDSNAPFNVYLANDVVYIAHEDPNYYYERAKAMPGSLPPDSSVVVITGEDGNVFFKKEYNTSNVRLWLNYYSMPNGDYTLHFYWRETWWKGDFFFKTHKPDGLSVYVDSTYYRLNNGTAVIEEPDINGRTRSQRMYWNAFERDYPLHVVIPEELSYEGETYQVISVEGGSFQYCHFLLSVSLPNTVTFIGDCAFANCDNLPQIKIPESVTDIGFAAFSECDKLSFIVIPEGINTLRNQMFIKCINLSAVTLPGSLVTIEDHAFAGCTSLPYIDIPDNVTFIGSDAFCRCKTLMDIKLPAKLKVIEDNAFLGCTSLASVTLPERMTRIGEKAFFDMPSSGHIYSNAKKPFTISANTFNYNCTLHVPQGCKEAYEEADFWKNFTTIVEDEDTKDNEVYIFAGDMTGVESAVEAESAERFFDLQGRLVDGTQKGILIRNGKKVLVK